MWMVGLFWCFAWLYVISGAYAFPIQSCEMNVRRGAVQSDNLIGWGGKLNQFKCEVICDENNTGFTPAIKWFRINKNGSRRRIKGFKRRVYAVRSKFDLISTLTFRNFLERDAGKYMCTASIDGKGSVKESIVTITYGCDIPYLRCDEYRCIPKQFLCDGLKQCTDGTDEEYCDSTTESWSPINPQTIATEKETELEISPEGLTTISEEPTTSTPEPTTITQEQTTTTALEPTTTTTTTTTQEPTKMTTQKPTTTTTTTQEPTTTTTQEPTTTTSEPTTTTTQEQTTTTTTQEPTTTTQEPTTTTSQEPTTTTTQEPITTRLKTAELDVITPAMLLGPSVPTTTFTEEECLPNYEFMCTNGQCIDIEWVCDSEFDCEDKSDELNCNKTIEGCLLKEFVCNVGKCISMYKVCDGVFDCPFAEDEENCGCKNGEFECADGECISFSSRCDAYPDCVDGSDEENCTAGSVCIESMIPCLDNSVCYKEEQKCDGKSDCSDGSDELNCPTTASIGNDVIAGRPIEETIIVVDSDGETTVDLYEYDPYKLYEDYN